MDMGNNRMAVCLMAVCIGCYEYMVQTTEHENALQWSMKYKR